MHAAMARDFAGGGTIASARDDMRDAALLMQADFRTLRGMFAAFRLLGEAPDPIDPAAISVLAASGEEALARILSLRTQMDGRNDGY